MNERHHPRDSRDIGKINALAVVPARLLPYRQQWQILANALPPGSILVCFPVPSTAVHQDAWEAVVRSMRATGHPVLVLSMERFLESMRHG